MQYDDGTKRTYKGTFRSVKCLKLAVKPDGRTPTGTLTCNHCARVPTLQSFVSRIEKVSVAQHKFLPNKFLSTANALTKLDNLYREVRLLRQQVARNKVRKRTVVAQEAEDT